MASMFQNGISRNTKCAERDSFHREGHKCLHLGKLTSCTVLVVKMTVRYLGNKECLCFLSSKSLFIAQIKLSCHKCSCCVFKSLGMKVYYRIPCKFIKDKYLSTST